MGGWPSFEWVKRGDLSTLSTLECNQQKSAPFVFMIPPSPAGCQVAVFHFKFFFVCQPHPRRRLIPAGRAFNYVHAVSYGRVDLFLKIK